MSRFTSVGSGGGEPGPQGPAGPAGPAGQTPNLSSYAGDIIPSEDNVYVLGNSSYHWKSISVGDGTIYITDAVTGEEAALTIENGVFFIDGIAQAQLPNIQVTNLIFSDDTAQTTAAVAQVNSDWNATSGLAEILNKPTLLKGDQGDQGPAGADGAQGPQGDAGAKGNQGDPGADGLDGADGITPFTIVGAYNNGASYNLGIAVYYNGGTYVRTGNPNNPGYPPEPGTINASWTPIADKGDTGLKGDTGNTGTTGANGQQGIQGIKGDTGNTGATGSQGIQGIKGDKGDTGNQGPIGLTGSQGLKGDKGDTGATGETGPAGLAGTVTSYASTLSSTNLAYSGTPTTAHYIANGKMNYVDISVSLATVTNFGQNGVQYLLTLPFTAAYDALLIGQCTIAGIVYEIGGKVTAGSNSIGLQYCLSNGNNTPNTWEIFTKQKPVNMTTATTFYISGTYISQ